MIAHSFSFGGLRDFRKTFGILKSWSTAKFNTLTNEEIIEAKKYLDVLRRDERICRLIVEQVPQLLKEIDTVYNEQVRFKTRLQEWLKLSILKISILMRVRALKKRFKYLRNHNAATEVRGSSSTIR